jgi:uncharacterized protein
MEQEVALHNTSLGISSFTLKIAARCNLNCSYCYVYNKGDNSWKNRSPVMPEEVFRAAVARVRNYCETVQRKSISITFHGGEPTLVGPDRLDTWCSHIRRELDGVAEVSLGIQTNGTLLTSTWADLFLKHRMRVGLSVDGPKEIHDIARVDFFGRGSYARVKAGAELLRAAGVPFGILSVVQLGVDPLVCHSSLVDLGCKSVGYMLPHFTHDTIGPIRDRYGPTPCADFLLPILDDWWANSTMDLRIREFWNIGRLIMGGRSKVDGIGNDALGFLFVESDGEIEGLDVLRACDGSLYQTGLNVLHNDFLEVLDASDLHRRLLTGTVPLPSACLRCSERETCAGGYFPHRFSKTRGFDNSSVWCADLLALFRHMRLLLGVSPEETERMRTQLSGRLELYKGDESGLGRSVRTHL